MKKLFIIVTLLLVTVSLFAQDLEGKDVKKSSSNKNIIRVHAETLFVFEGDANRDSWADGSWDYALGGLGLSYSRLFSDQIGITVVVGLLAGGVEDPFDKDCEVDFFAGSYPFDIDRVGAFAKIGPYIRFGRFAITPALESAVVIGGNWKDGETDSGIDQLVGISCSFEYLVTDSFVVFIEGSVLAGYRFEDSIWDYEDEDEDYHYSFFEAWYGENSKDLLACSLTLGVGIAF